MRTQQALTVQTGLRLLLVAVGTLLAGPTIAATMQLVIDDAPGEGFNDPTPVSPVGGNQGTTLGAQRRVALQYAADILGSRIDSAVPIRIAARFDNLGCTRNSATLGQAAPATYTANFGASAARADVYYPVALANALRGRRVAGVDNDIQATFNTALDAGDNDCLRGRRWYYGLDGAQPGAASRFVSTAVHELTHGLGFVSLVRLQDSASARVGQFPAAASNGRRLPDIFSSFIQDLSFDGQPLWPDLTDEQRAASLTNDPYVVWSAANTNSQAMTVLSDGFSQGRLQLYAPAVMRPGSSISHWDTRLTPDQIMEPFATDEDEVTAGIGLSACVLEDIGWSLINGTRCPDIDAPAIAGAPADTTREPASVNGVDAQIDADTAVSSGDDSTSSGGGCTLVGGQRADPLWLAMLVLAALSIGYRRRRG
ncbi:JDVT-CTERM domain-containing protein [Salinisphaera sp. T31B1]|uniref:JDVT-CTERM domain-containing protein n=1 Tax=Salinisphaera sp. T31B1 TaxID=727963 RepID=UPI0033428918